MTALQNLALEVTTRSVFSVATCHALHQFLPAPNGHALMVMGTVHACACVLLRTTAFAVSNALSSHYGVSNPKLPNFCSTIASVLIPVLLPIFYRYFCRRLGYQAPDYLQTLAYLSLTNAAWWTTINAADFILVPYYLPPAK